MALVKAVIVIEDDKAIDPSRGLPALIHVQFNPTEYTLSAGAKIDENPTLGIESPISQFVHGQNEKLTLDLFFILTEHGMGENAKDVREVIRAGLPVGEDPAKNACATPSFVCLG